MSKVCCWLHAQIGSFAASEEGVKAVVEHAAIPQLLRALHSSEARVVEAAVRSLKMVYKVCPTLQLSLLLCGQSP